MTKSKSKIEVKKQVINPYDYTFNIVTLLEENKNISKDNTNLFTTFDWSSLNKIDIYEHIELKNIYEKKDEGKSLNSYKHEYMSLYMKFKSVNNNGVISWEDNDITIEDKKGQYVNEDETNHYKSIKYSINRNYGLPNKIPVEYKKYKYSKSKIGYLDWKERTLYKDEDGKNIVKNSFSYIEIQILSIYSIDPYPPLFGLTNTVETSDESNKTLEVEDVQGNRIECNVWRSGFVEYCVFIPKQKVDILWYKEDNNLLIGFKNSNTKSIESIQRAIHSSYIRTKGDSDGYRKIERFTEIKTIISYPGDKSNFKTSNENLLKSLDSKKEFKGFKDIFKKKKEEKKR